MEHTYTENLNADGEVISIQRSDGWSIPIDPANSDYQRYLNPEAEQSTPNLAANAD